MRFQLLTLIFAFCLGVGTGSAASGIWSVNSGGSWELPTNWSASAIADGVDAMATFSNDTAGVRAVTLGTARALGNLAFSDTDPLTPGSWSLAGTMALTLIVTSGSPSIAVGNLATGETATLGVPLAGAAFSKSGPGTLVLSGTNSFTTSTLSFAAAASGTIRLASATALGGITTISMPGTNANISRIELEGNITLGAKITTAGRSDSVFLRNLSGVNTWIGDISISNTGGSYTIESTAGTLNLGGVISSNVGTGRTFILSGAGIGVVSGTVQNGSSTVSLIKDGPGTWTFSGTNTYTGTTTLSAGKLEIGTDGEFGTGAVTNNALVAFNQTNGLVVSNIINGSGSIQVLAGPLTLSGSNSYSGGTQTLGERRLSVANDGALGSGLVTLGDVPGSAQVWFHSAGDHTLANPFEIRTQRWIIDANAINGATAGSLSITGNVYLNQSGAKDILCNKPLTLAGAVTSSGGLIKQGGATLTLSGTANYSGTTSVTTGTLAVEGTLTSPGTLTVGSSDTLTGSGVITSPVSISAGGKLVPGTVDSGDLQTGALTLAATATLELSLGAPDDPSNTRLAVTGNFSANGTLNLTSKSGFSSGTYTLATYTGSLTGAGFQTLSIPGGFIGNLITTTPGQIKIQILAASAIAPANNAMLSLSNSLTLDWTPPPGVVSYDVYLGTSATTVSQATTTTAGTYQGRISADQFTASGFTNGTTHYWRIDYILADGTVFKGPLWNFTLVTEQDAMMDTWVATDGLNRTLPGFSQTGPPRVDRPTAIFYFLWHYKGGLGSDGPRDNTQEILRLGGYTDKRYPWADNPLWMTGSNGRSWYWGEPESGYYASDDEWVIRRHIMLLTAAGVDILAFDNTNGHPQTYQASYTKIAETIRKMRREGMKIDLKFLFVTHGGTGGSPATMTWLYENLYKPGLYPELWLMWDGKPAIIGYPDGIDPADTPVTDEVRNFFTLRTGWANGGSQRNDWQWIDTPTPQNYGYGVRQDIPEQLPVACGGWCNGNLGRSNFNRTQPTYDNLHLTTARTEGLGRFFSEQLHYGLKFDPKLMFITGWNEWWAGAWTTPVKGGGYRILDNFPEIGERYFVDNYNAEYSRDIEPMTGGFGDNYYYQMVAANRLRKGTRPTPLATAAQTISGGDAAAFATTGPTYFDAPDETIARDWGASFSNLPSYTNTTGRNDFRQLKVARDATNLYFYAETKNAITPSNETNWMMLFLDTDQSRATGWEGYDYALNLGGSGMVKRFNSTTWTPTNIGSASVSVTGNKLVITVPRALLGLSADPLKFDFHWVDNVQTLGDIADFGISGDSAPERRFNYRYQTTPEQSVIARSDGFENGQHASWGETYNADSQWQITTTTPYTGTKCLVGTGRSGATDASGTLINHTSTAGLTSFRTAFRYKLSNVQDAQNIQIYLRNNLNQWIPIREIGRDQFHTSSQAWGYNEPQNVWLYFSDSRINAGADAAYFHSNFAVHIQIKNLTSPTQTIAIDDFEISAMQVIPAPGAATSPTPANAATGIPTTTTLSWTPGANGITQQIHFGTTGNLQLIATLDGTAITQSPPALTASTTYAWRIDTVNPAGTTTGPTWTFATAPPPNQPPVLAEIPGLSLVAGQTASFTASGSDPDVPAQPLTYSLQNSPPGAGIHPISGAFTWRPTQIQAAGSYPMMITVTDNGSPPLSAQRSFTIHVASAVTPTAFSASLGIDGTFRFQVNGDAGPDYRVWFSENLLDWSLLQTILTPTPPFWIEDPAAGNFPQRFYRLSLAP